MLKYIIFVRHKLRLLKKKKSSTNNGTEREQEQQNIQMTQTILKQGSETGELFDLDNNKDIRDQVHTQCKILRKWVYCILQAPFRRTSAVGMQ